MKHRGVGDKFYVKPVRDSYAIELPRLYQFSYSGREADLSGWSGSVLFEGVSLAIRTGIHIRLAVR